MSKMIVVRIPQELHAEVASIADDREVPFRDGLATVLKAGVSRVRALDRHAQTRAENRKKKSRPKRRR